MNTWTPAHNAAVRNDIKALEILINHGAVLEIRTTIDDYATVLEEKNYCDALESVKFIENL